MSKSPLQPIKDNSEMNSVQSIINGSNCLLPVSENEDMQIKAALVNLRKLKLDIEIKNEATGNASGVRMSQKDHYKIGVAGPFNHN
jgi:hypothetical protein